MTVLILFFATYNVFTHYIIVLKNIPKIKIIKKIKVNL